MGKIARLNKEKVWERLRPFFGLMMDYHEGEKEILLIDLFATSEYGECFPALKIEDERLGRLLGMTIDLAQEYLTTEGMTDMEMVTDFMKYADEQNKPTQSDNQ